ncbi:DUF1737 domain-containing protein [Chryseobacterium indologenes]|nr:DUF1737 domain-containing protein [Chryseobacterium indologenes]
MKYKIVSADSPHELEKAVNILLDLGWIPQGGISAGDKVFFQALVKKK